MFGNFQHRTSIKQPQITEKPIDTVSQFLQNTPVLATYLLPNEAARFNQAIAPLSKTKEEKPNATTVRYVDLEPKSWLIQLATTSRKNIAKLVNQFFINLENITSEQIEEALLSFVEDNQLTTAQRTRAINCVAAWFTIPQNQICHPNYLLVLQHCIVFLSVTNAEKAIDLILLHNKNFSLLQQHIAFLKTTELRQWLNKIDEFLVAQLTVCNTYVKVRPNTVYNSLEAIYRIEEQTQLERSPLHRISEEENPKLKFELKRLSEYLSTIFTHSLLISFISLLIIIATLALLLHFSIIPTGFALVVFFLDVCLFPCIIGTALLITELTFRAEKGKLSNKIKEMVKQNEEALLNSFNLYFNLWSKLKTSDGIANFPPQPAHVIEFRLTVYLKLIMQSKNTLEMDEMMQALLKPLQQFWEINKDLTDLEITAKIDALDEPHRSIYASYHEFCRSDSDLLKQYKNFSRSATESINNPATAAIAEAETVPFGYLAALRTSRGIIEVPPPSIRQPLQIAAPIIEF